MSQEHVLELARHLTERDRELCGRLYDHQVLTTDQIELLFFSSKRRAQDRLLFLYRSRVLDRFYPPSPFGQGKAQAHWLLDEAGAILVAAMKGIERRKLNWQRREDWASHPQLRHRLEVNRFVTDLVRATLPDSTLGVTDWMSTSDAATNLSDEDRYGPRPDCGLILDTERGPIECYLEWDRGTETQERLKDKLRSYWSAESHVRLFAPEPRTLLFVVPGSRRIETLRRAYAQVREREEERVRRDRWATRFEPSQPVVAATAGELRREGVLARVWLRIDAPRQASAAITELPVRGDLGPTDLELALGRRWRKERADFWERLSPLGRHIQGEPSDDPEPEEPAPPDPRAEAFLERLRLYREGTLEEARRDIAAARAGRRWGSEDDLHPSADSGLIDDLEEEDQWT